MDLRTTGAALGVAEGFAVATADGVADALGVGLGVGFGVALAVGVGVALGVGVGLGEGSTTGVDVPPPVKPPLGGGAAAEIEKVRDCVADAYLVVADALAVIVQLPTVNETVPEDTVQLPDAVNVTGTPETELAETLTVPEPVCEGIVEKLLIVWATLTTLKLFGVTPSS